MLAGWIFTLGKFCQRGFTQRHCLMIRTFQKNTHTHRNKHRFREHFTSLEVAYCKHGALCVFCSVFSGCLWFGYNSFLKAKAWHPTASPVGLLLFLFFCCSHIAFHGLLTWEQSAWIYCSCNAIFPRKGDLHSRCEESVIASVPPPFLLLMTARLGLVANQHACWWLFEC